MKRITRAICIIALGLFGMLAPERADAQWVLLQADADSLVKKGLVQMYNLQYQEADSTFNLVVQRHPDHPAGYFLLALVDWWRIVPNADVESKVDRFSSSFNQRIDKVIDVCDQRLDNNPADIVGLFFKASAMGYQARLKVLRNFNASSMIDMVSALMDGAKAYEILLECQRLAPSNSDILLGSGLVNYMAEMIPQQYPAAKPMLGFLPPGDRQIGLNMLRISSKRAQYAGTEAKYALLELLTQFEGTRPETRDGALREALQIAQELHAAYPGNPVFYRYLAKNYYMTGDFTAADSAYADILRKIKRRESGYELTLARQGLYYLGDIRLRQGRLEDAIKLFQEADQQSKRLDDDETGWMVMSNLRMGNAYDLLNRRSDAIRQYKKVLSMSDYQKAHENAKKYLANAYK